MGQADVLYAKVKQGEPGLFLARIRSVTGALITQSATSAITYVIYDLLAGTATAPTSITIVGAIYDALQTNSVIWPIDSTGYNFYWISPQTAFPNAGRNQQYRVEIKVTFADGSKTTLRYNVNPDPVLSSPL